MSDETITVRLTAKQATVARVALYTLAQEHEKTANALAAQGWADDAECCDKLRATAHTCYRAEVAIWEAQYIYPAETASRDGGG